MLKLTAKRSVASSLASAERRQEETMQIVEHYLRHAEDCLTAAKQTEIPAHRKAIGRIADWWIKLANERLACIVEKRLLSRKREPGDA
jgi:hypothetical protein